MIEIDRIKTTPSAGKEILVKFTFNEGIFSSTTTLLTIQQHVDMLYYGV